MDDDETKPQIFTDLHRNSGEFLPRIRAKEHEDALICHRHLASNVSLCVLSGAWRFIPCVVRYRFCVLCALLSCHSSVTERSPAIGGSPVALRFVLSVNSAEG